MKKSARWQSMLDMYIDTSISKYTYITWYHAQYNKLLRLKNNAGSKNMHVECWKYQIVLISFLDRKDGIPNPKIIFQ